MTDIDFRDIRSLGGSQPYGFEEYCTHLARRFEEVPDGSSFTRLEGAGGDGGVECFWTLPDGSEWGWQTKYIGELDKAQIGASVKTALKIHPRLTRYIVCLPFNLSGPTGRPGTDMLTRWNGWVTEWEKEAADLGMKVSFELWEASELLERLIAIDPDGGRRRFWFDTEPLSLPWFTERLDDAKRDAGPRYHPELNVEVPIAAAFETFARTPRWQSERRSAIRTLADLVSRMDRRLEERENSEATQMFAAASTAVNEFLRSLERHAADPSALGDLHKDAAVTTDSLNSAHEALRAELEENHGEGAASSRTFREHHAEYMVNFPAEDYDLCGKLLKQVADLGRIDDPAEVAAERGALLVTGPAGTGKTHAICDAAVDRLKRGLLSIVVMGEKLGPSDPLDQIRESLGLPADIGREEFLGALETAAEASHSPLVIFVDALNDRKPRSAWKADLASFVAQVERRPWLRLCLSCRSIYLEEVLPENLGLSSIEHRGFTGVEFEACFAFFSHWNLEPPSVPLLQPEFTNPLFLRLLCIGLSREPQLNLDQNPPSLAEVIDLLLEDVEKRAQDQLGVDKRHKPVATALDVLLKEMLAVRSTRMPWKRVVELLAEISPVGLDPEGLRKFLVAEGMLGEFEPIEGDGEWEVRFGFERLGDFLYVSRVLNEVGEQFGDLLAEGGPFARREDRPPADLRGFLEALAILLPERHGVELPDLNTDLPRRVLLASFVASLAWRRPDSVDARSRELLIEALNHPRLFLAAMEQLMMLGARPGHSLGVEVFEDLMRSKTMIERDAIMCRFLHQSWERGGAVRRLSDWATRPDLGDVSRSTALDWSRILLWQCLAADRRVRDQATMGVVGLMQRHPDAIVELLKRFADVDDDYILERLYQAAYGALLRSQDSGAAGEVAEVATKVFAAPPTNAVIRDGARCLVELAEQWGVLSANVDLGGCRPPYGSELPADLQLLETQEVIEGGGESADGEGDGEEIGGAGFAWDRVRRSVEHDDFQIYTIPYALKSSRRPRLDLAAAQRWILEEIERFEFGGEQIDHYDQTISAQFGGGRSRESWAERIGKKYQWIGLYRLIGLVEDNMPPKLETYVDEPEPPADLPPGLQASHERTIDPTLLVRDLKTAERSAWWSPQEQDFAPNLSDATWLDELRFPDSAELVAPTSPDGRPQLTLLSYSDWNNREGDNFRDPYRFSWMHVRAYLVAAEHAEEFWEWAAQRNFGGAWMPTAPEWLDDLYAGEYPDALQARTQLFGYYTEALEEKVPVPVLPAALDDTVAGSLDSYHAGPIHIKRPTKALLEGSDLNWDGLGGYRRGDRQIFSMPSFSEPGPGALLVDREWAENWLAENEMEIFWTTLSELQVSQGFGDHNYGYALHSRAHRLDRDGTLSSSEGISVRRRPGDPR